MAPAYIWGMLLRHRHFQSARRQGGNRAGFSLIEMLVTVSMLAIMVGMAAPNVSKDITHGRVNGAAQIVAADLEQAMSLAGRQRRPVRVTRGFGTRATARSMAAGASWSGCSEAIRKEQACVELFKNATGHYPLRRTRFRARELGRLALCLRLSHGARAF